MNTKSYILIIIISLLTGCGVLMFRDVACRDFKIKGENYWFPLHLGDSVVFVNASNIRKKFIVEDKQISHRKEYTSDTGCGCLDVSKMLLISDTDSIWFTNELRYVEDTEGNYYEDILFVIQGEQSGFYETAKTILDTYTLHAIKFIDVELFECSNCTDGVSVKKMYRAKNIGIIQFELVNGEVWTNENLTNFGTTTKDSFEFSENTCN